MTNSTFFGRPFGTATVSTTVDATARAAAAAAQATADANTTIIDRVEADAGDVVVDYTVGTGLKVVRAEDSKVLFVNNTGSNIILSGADEADLIADGLEPLGTGNADAGIEVIEVTGSATYDHATYTGTATKVSIVNRTGVEITVTGFLSSPASLPANRAKDLTKDALGNWYEENDPVESSFVFEALTVAIDGQTAFNLSDTPYNALSAYMVVNGLVYRAPTHITVSGNTITWLDVDFTMATTDEVFAYYELPESLEPLTTEQLTISTDGQTALTLGGTPTDPTSVRIEVNGITYHAPTHFTVAGSAVTWLNTGFSLVTADEIYAVWR